ncbi:MAG: DUF2330 domain-containing protein [Planctomycetes bacterium]|nr:DUF2330 domain-containing protein [Planctomycetota bacterium]
MKRDKKLLIIILMVRPLLYVCFLFIICSLRLSADGKFFSNDKIPPDEPYQRAIIIHDKGEELLIIQPKIETTSKQFGWIIPVPGEAKMGFIEQNSMRSLLFSLSLGSQPKVIEISTILFFIAAIALILSIGFNTYNYIRYKKRYSRYSSYIALLSLLCLLAVLFPMNILGETLAGAEVISREQIGIYDAKIVKATNSGDLINWLKTNGFNYTNEDKNSFDQYIRKNWVFVTLLATTEGKLPGEILNYLGMVQPIALLFKTAEPVYPYALTGTYNKASVLLLYVLSNKRVEFDHLKTIYAGVCSGFAQEIMNKIQWSGAEAVDPMKFNNATFLTKLKGTISEFNEDILLKYHKNNDDYKSIVFHW